MSKNDKSNSEYDVIIPSEVMYDKDLNPQAKLLYGEILTLCNRGGCCQASNGHFAKLYGVGKETISLWVRQLKQKGLVREGKFDGRLRTLYSNRTF